MLPETKLIAFDTSAAHCAAALLLGDRIVTRVDEMAKGQAEHLMPMLQDMLTAEGLGWRDLDGLGVGTGPGNFTGIRIAVSAARGLALGLGKPAIGVNGFEARAFGAGYPVTALIPAPRDQCYLQDFDAAGAAGKPVLVPRSSAVLSHPAAPEKSADMLIGAVARITAAQLDRPAPRPAPLYVRNADAAPPRDSAPVILP
ncbi:tRNA (adenosine(37)-N6)-threonylcarbamoyltransferase complex dimerization subunit type 1 TsaB [Loktanella agnita]|uniref:tRNA (adenosine(37)-N6)-threonylcarbamoyltransferase complex dimerization subunit type 1 TsaB n=1 Tax=Loktanella agnita TaxID=287097 RepID=UPI003987C772